MEHFLRELPVLPGSFLGDGLQFLQLSVLQLEVLSQGGIAQKLRVDRQRRRPEDRRRVQPRIETDCLGIVSVCLVQVAPAVMNMAANDIEVRVLGSKRIASL